MDLQSCSWVSSDLVSLFSLKNNSLKSISALYMPEYHFHLIDNCIRESSGRGGFKNMSVTTYIFTHKTGGPQNYRSTKPPSYILAWHRQLNPFKNLKLNMTMLSYSRGYFFFNFYNDYLIIWIWVSVDTYCLLMFI